MWKSLIVWATVLLGSPQTQAISQEMDCKTAMGAHGMLSRAQFQCGFRRYSTAKMDLASVCFKTLGEEESKKVLQSGIEYFDEQVKSMGKKKACQAMLDSFPDYIRR